MKFTHFIHTRFNNLYNFATAEAQGCGWSPWSCCSWDIWWGNFVMPWWIHGMQWIYGLLFGHSIAQRLLILSFCLMLSKVTDVADASLLNRLFRHLFSTGTVSSWIYMLSVVSALTLSYICFSNWVMYYINVYLSSWKVQILISTSNRAPDNLYERGLQRDLFLPFISTLKVCISWFLGSIRRFGRRLLIRQAEASVLCSW